MGRRRSVEPLFADLPVRSEIVKVARGSRVTLRGDFMTQLGWKLGKNNVFLVADLASPGHIRLFQVVDVQAKLETVKNEIVAPGTADFGRGSLVGALVDRYQPLMLSRPGNRVVLHERILLWLGIHPADVRGDRSPYVLIETGSACLHVFSITAAEERAEDARDDTDLNEPD